MTEVEWNSCADPQPMLGWLREQGRLSERKGRLFVVACCRRIWPLLTDERSRRAAEVAERYADGRASGDERRAAWDAASEARQDAWAGSYEKDDYPAAAAEFSLGELDEFIVGAGMCAGASDSRLLEGAQQAALLRDLINPFRITAFDPAWRTTAALALARTIYDDRTFDLLLPLADALEEAGCTDAALVGHLRSPGPHFRGCFALDAVLGQS